MSESKTDAGLTAERRAELRVIGHRMNLTRFGYMDSTTDCRLDGDDVIALADMADRAEFLEGELRTALWCVKNITTRTLTRSERERIADMDMSGVAEALGVPCMPEGWLTGAEELAFQTNRADAAEAKLAEARCDLRSWKRQSEQGVEVLGVMQKADHWLAKSHDALEARARVAEAEADELYRQKMRLRNVAISIRNRLEEMEDGFRRSCGLDSYLVDLRTVTAEMPIGDGYNRASELIAVEAKKEPNPVVLEMIEDELKEHAATWKAMAKGTE